MQNLQWWRMEQQKGNRGAKHKHRLNSNLDIERALIKTGGKSGCNKHSTDNDGRTLHLASLINTTFPGQQADKASSKTSHQPARQRQLEVKANLVVLRTWRGIWRKSRTSWRANIRPVSRRSKGAGEALVSQRRTIHVGGLTVKLPKPPENCRGGIRKRRSSECLPRCTETLRPAPEPPTTRLRRIAACMEGGESKGANPQKRGAKAPRRGKTGPSTTPPPTTSPS